MSDSDLHEESWRAWIADVCAAVGVDPDAVSVADVHALTRAVAHDFVRPMAPVSAYVWGLARAAHPDADPDELRDQIVAAIPPRA